VIALIETDAGLSNFAEIAAVPGLDASMFGPFDYAHEVGLPGQPQHEQVRRRYAEALKVASGLGHPVVASLFSRDPEAMGREAQEFAAQGVRAVVAGSDRRVIYTGLQARLDGMRSTRGKADVYAA
jgi:4-hydroxy-2-oxoheptanedioate aldolase